MEFAISVFIVLNIAISLSSAVEDTKVTVKIGVQNAISTVNSLGDSRLFEVTEVPERVLSISISGGPDGKDGFLSEPADLGVDTALAVAGRRVLELFSSDVRHAQVLISPGGRNEVVIDAPLEPSAVLSWAAERELGLSLLDVPNLHRVIERRGRHDAFGGGVEPNQVHLA